MGLRRTWTDAQFIEAVASSRSVAQVLRALKLQATGANYQTFKTHAARLEVNTQHFLGQGWNVGRSPVVRKPLAEILVENSTYVNTPSLKARLVAEGLLKYECFECQLVEWRGQPLVLHLEHKNGKSRDHRLENLCLLCPNCHSQTLTYCRRMSARSPMAEAHDSKSCQ